MPYHGMTLTPSVPSYRRPTCHHNHYPPGWWKRSCNPIGTGSLRAGGTGSFLLPTGPSGSNAPHVQLGNETILCLLRQVFHFYSISCFRESPLLFCGVSSGGEARVSDDKDVFIGGTGHAHFTRFPADFRSTDSLPRCCIPLFLWVLSAR